MRPLVLCTLAAAALVQGCAHGPGRDAPRWLAAAPPAQQVRATALRDEYCSYEVRTGSRFPEWVCVRRSELRSRETRSVEMLRAWQRGGSI